LAKKKYGKKLQNQARKPTSIPITALEKKTLKLSIQLTIISKQFSMYLIRKPHAMRQLMNNVR